MIISRLPYICVYVVSSILLVWFSNAFESRFIYDFIKNDLITILLALMAINTTTSSVIMTKLKEISDANSNANFTDTVKELKVSFLEQLVHIFIAVIILVILDSKVSSQIQIFNLIDVCNVLLISVFIASIHNLYDTADSVFVILDFENKK